MKRFAVALALISFSTTASAGTARREAHEGRELRVYSPDGELAGKPVVVVLHGCTQTADDVADASQMDALADEKGFVAIYPEQSAASGLNRCWEWWETGNQTRDSGEPKDIAGAVAAIVDARGLDPERVYVAGISAGGAMSVVLGATYPDRFAAIGVLAGIEYGGASALSEVYATSMNGGPDPKAQGERAHAAMGSYARVVPALVIHGDADGVVAPVNGTQVAAQWLRTNTLVLGDAAIGEPTTTSGEAGYPFTHTVHASRARGGSIVEHILVKGLGHAWPGGRAGGSFADAKGPDASRTLWAFFEKRSLSQPIPDAAAPTDIASPAPTQPSATASPSSAGEAGRDASDGCATTSRRLYGSSWVVLVFVVALGARRRFR